MCDSLLSSLYSVCVTACSSPVPCEEFQKKLETFAKWLLQMEAKVAERRLVVRPISTVGTELEEHYVRSNINHARIYIG